MVEKVALVPFEQKTLVITNVDDYKTADGEVGRTKQYIKDVEAYWAKDINDAHTHHLSLCAKRDAALAGPEDYKTQLLAAMQRWQDAETARVAAEQIRLNEEARQRAEEEQLANAISVVDQRPDMADAILAAPTEIAPTYVFSHVPKTDGATNAKRLFLTVTDERAVLLAVAAGEMLDVLEKSTNYTERASVTKFLATFGPVKNKLVYIGDVKTGPLRADANKLQDAFKVPGVTAEWKKALS